ncbi:GNAT family N-acetyltransferase [Gynurincola endophyticus]|uniref:GNAT family N-acetyltransferase n=1 Tax=Gynurincola endophyticus TaxID=2479004 RepID=UPI000F8EA60C|nr:GNAT family N-acetyltransferase [Gynurincola endophyticus]
MEIPIIRTDKIMMRPFEDTDLEQVFNGLSNPDVIRYYGVSYDSLEACKEQMQWYKQLQENNTGAWWAICSLDNKVFYGASGISGYSKQHHKAEIGYWLLPEFWGRGIITTAAALVCLYAFELFALHRIEAIIEPQNASSKKVMHKLGFQYEGTMRDAEIKNGQYIDLEMYSKLITDTNGR